METLKKQYGVAKTTIYKYSRIGPPAEGLEKVAKDEDCAIIGLAVCGPETLGVFGNAVALAKAGLPVVCIAVERDAYLLDKLAQSRKINLSIVTMPEDPENMATDKAIKMMKAIIGDIVKALQNPPKLQVKEPAAEPFIDVPRLSGRNERHYVPPGLDRRAAGSPAD